MRSRISAATWSSPTDRAASKRGGGRHRADQRRGFGTHDGQRCGRRPGGDRHAPVANPAFGHRRIAGPPHGVALNISPTSTSSVSLRRMYSSQNSRAWAAFAPGSGRSWTDGTPRSVRFGPPTDDEPGDTWPGRMRRDPTSQLAWVPVGCVGNEPVRGRPVLSSIGSGFGFLAAVGRELPDSRQRMGGRWRSGLHGGRLRSAQTTGQPRR